MPDRRQTGGVLPRSLGASRPVGASWRLDKIPVKAWGSSKFFGLDYEFEPMWLLTEEERNFVVKLAELCRKHIRPHAAKVDNDYIYPRDGLRILANHNYMSLLVPREYGGRGASNFLAMLALETIARYGDPAVAVIFAMHLISTCILCSAHFENNAVQDLLRRLDAECLIGAVAVSDPTTGGHFWYYLSAKTARTKDNRIRLHKFISWVTSAGYADFYIVGAPDPDFVPFTDAEELEERTKTAMFLLFRSELRASSEGYRAMGMHGNHAGPAFCEAILGEERLLTRHRHRMADGLPAGDDFAPVFHFFQSSIHVGIASAAIDAAKSHVVNRIHADTGKRIAEYPIIQDYFGDAISNLNSCRCLLYDVIRKLDAETDSNNWTKHKDPMYRPRKHFVSWAYQIKIVVAQMSDDVCSNMMRACGGSGYTAGLGVERLLRDTKALWLMSPSVEVARKLVGQMALSGINSVDLHENHCDYASLYKEMNKLTGDEKRAIASRMLMDADIQQGKSKLGFESQGHDFDNPFGTGPTTYNDIEQTDKNGVRHGPAFHPVKWVRLKLAEKKLLDAYTLRMVFALPNKTDHTGCLPGQYIQTRVWKREATRDGDSRDSRRFYSPISRPDDYGRIEVLVRVERNGIMARHMRVMEVGDDTLEFRGPSGGFEYYPDTLDYLVAITGGCGVTPADNPADNCKFILVYANNTASEILLKKELNERASRKDGKVSVTFVLADSSEADENPLTRETFIDEAFLRSILSAEMLQKRFRVLLCGGAGLIVSVLYALRSLLIPSETIFVFGSTGTSYLKAVYGRHALLASHRSDQSPIPKTMETAGEGCSVRQLMGPDGRQQLIVGNQKVCPGLRLEGWREPPVAMKGKTGAFYIVPTKSKYE
ncbi:unnamed protein product [Notodromas monacha]|uniref:FAD-binding FR-type domain-containing protein n=1 Tax=Notodromas monacha TaxID=399045 RepID=A0A7R9BM95_9CRUS|nr:unnamed protein product [Notodromas monacha]CAG0917272.1 unnamed protein product [Notodromas monacha]